MMNRIIIVMGCACIITLFSVSGLAQDQIPEQGLYIELTQDSMIFSLGDHSVHGTIYGVQNDELFTSIEDLVDDPLLSPYINRELIENLHILPIMGTIVLTNISKITMIQQQVLESFNPEDFLDIIQAIQVFSDVSLSLSNGLFLMGTKGGPIQYNFKANSSIAGFLPLSLENIPSVHSYISVSEDPSDASYQYQNNHLLFYPFSENTDIRILSSTGEELWKNENEQQIYLLENDEFSIKVNSFIHFVPLSGAENHSTFYCNVIPSPQDPQIMEIINNLNEFEEFDDSILGFISENDMDNQLVSSLSSMLNGAMVIANNSKNVVIDGEDHSFKRFGFTRVNQATITSSSSDFSVTADYALIFLGDHFYSSPASESESGVSLPIIPIILWISAIFCIVFFHFKVKKTDQSFTINDKKIYYISIIAQCFGYIIAFFLIDSAVYYQFGISFFQELSKQGMTFITGILFVVQCILWVFGFLFATFPLSIIASKIMKYFGFDKTYQHFSKSFIALLIWPVASLYLTMLINIVFLFFNPFNAIL